MNAVAYLRRSTDKQELSLEQQRVEVERYCREKKLWIVEWYVDSGISGADIESRPAFQRMLADAPKGRFLAVVYWDVSRLLRTDMITGGHVAHILRTAGVVVHSVKDGPVDWNTLAGRLVWGIEIEGKQAFLRQLSGDVIRAQLQAARNGEWVSGKLPLGYVVKDKKLALGNPRDVEIVRRCFREYLSGKSLRDIAAMLNREGVPTPNGGRWYGSTIRERLTNVAYIGTFRWNVTTMGKFHSIVNGRGVEKPFSRERRVNDASDWIVIENNHPPIVDRTTFAAVQALLPKRRRRTTPLDGGGKFSLTGLVFCAECGSPMHGRRAQSGRVFYRCSGDAHRGECEGNACEQDAVLSCVLEYLAKNSPQWEKDAVRTIVERVRAAREPSRVDELRRQMDAAQKRLTRAKSRLMEVDRDMLRVVQEHIRDAADDVERLTRELEAASVPMDVIARDESERVRRLSAVVKSLLDNAAEMSPRRKRECLSQIVGRIEVRTEMRRTERRRFYELRGLSVVFVSDLFGSRRRSVQVRATA